MMSVLQCNALKLRKCWYLVWLVTVNKEEWKIHKSDDVVGFAAT